ncbi:glycerophosphodiester phosphodiesterase family protein [Marmoricola sp. RAF53]|uniref:glycerophosphodiester phosphodiesterase family protein n=1 Tax=Marmoricola sp. RAF53 TaxID=3233059 RepID=UPI003F94E753
MAVSFAPYAVRPAVIAHRGASGHRPEHTLAAYELAFRLGADAIELDLQSTRDGVVVCMHDVELSRTTDVASRPELAHLRRTVQVDGQQVTGWFLHDLSYPELRELRTRERWQQKRPASATFDGRWQVPTFDEVLALVDRESARSGVRRRVFAELKEVRHQVAHGLWLPELVADRARTRPDVTWIGFEEEALRALPDPAHRVRLFDKVPAVKDLGQVAGYASGIAVRRKAVVAREPDGSTGKPTKLVARAHRRGLDVLVWSHRAENQHLPTDYRIGSNPHGHGDAVGEASLLFDQGIDGLITDFPELAVAARKLSRLSTAG